MGLMGLGGLMAIVGGLLFVVVVVAAMRAAFNGVGSMITPLQSGLRALFMRGEALFNRAFGDRSTRSTTWAISFFLFWIVGAPAVPVRLLRHQRQRRLRSVEALTHGQWFAGGVLRSVHRYASDAMVLTMLLHLLRYFAFDRLRGFRWFSWVTGVVLLWLVYVAGINGYMLPWDRLAQFVTQASFEWLDWLPGFGGTLIRNFILPEQRQRPPVLAAGPSSTSACRCCVLLLMWVHVQRVPKASTQPPRPIAIGCCGMLLVLGCCAGASQGGRRICTAAGTLALDWFLLPVYPLLDPGRRWRGLGPGGRRHRCCWRCPGCRAARSAQARRLTLHPGPARVARPPGETLLEAGLRAGLACPTTAAPAAAAMPVHGAATAGRPWPVPGGRADRPMRARGETLMCCAVPLEDVEIEVDRRLERWPPPRRPLQRLQARVSAWSACRPTDAPVLSLPGGEHAALRRRPVPQHRARRRRQARAFSFANAAASGQPRDVIELHVRLIPGGRFTTHVFERMRSATRSTSKGRWAASRCTTASGRSCWSRRHRFRADQEHPRGRLPPRHPAADAAVLGRAAQRQDLYMPTCIERWEREHPNFRCVPVLSEAGADEGWSGPPRLRSRGAAGRPPGPDGLRGLRLRLGAHGRGGRARLPGPWPG
jgi:CDP-4-dehydro-6-deoxyglucose reductase